MTKCKHGLSTCPQCHVPEGRLHRHFKGGLYVTSYTGLLVGHGPEVECVTYIEIGKPERLFIRPVSQWTEFVEWPDGQRRPRFIEGRYVEEWDKAREDPGET